MAVISFFPPLEDERWGLKPEGDVREAGVCSSKHIQGHLNLSGCQGTIAMNQLCF